MLLPILSDQTVDWLLPPTLAKWLPNLRAGVEVPRVSGTISAPVIQTSALVMQPSRHPHLLLQLPYRDNRAGLWYYSSLLHGRLLIPITQKYFPSQKNISRLKINVFSVSKKYFPWHQNSKLFPVLQGIFAVSSKLFCYTKNIYTCNTKNNLTSPRAACLACLAPCRGPGCATRCCAPATPTPQTAATGASSPSHQACNWT